MTRKQFDNFISAVAKAAKDNALDINAVRLVLDDGACSAELYHVLNPGSGKLERDRFDAALDVFDADNMRGRSRGELFASA